MMALHHRPLSQIPPPTTTTTYTEMEESARADLVLEFVKSLSRYSDLLLAKLQRPVER